MFRFTIAVTQSCNLRCGYCYVAKNATRMTTDIARRAVDLAFSLAPADERLSVAFFGGEPLLELDRVREVARLIRNHPARGERPVDLSLVTNGTIFNAELVSLVSNEDILLCISCDGPPAIQDRQRPRISGAASSKRVEATIRSAVSTFPVVPVNAVYTPETCSALPDVVEYLSGLGVRRIHLNADFGSPWRDSHVAELRTAFARIGDWYVARYRAGDPHFVSVIDSKVAVILRGGYHPLETCQMGRREFAVSSSGFVYPCERLMGDGHGTAHAIGNVWDGLDSAAIARCPMADLSNANLECRSCGLAPYCMNWCACSNYFASGEYERVSPFLCALEQTLIETARAVISPLLELGPDVLAHHVAGLATFNSSFGLS